MNIHTHNTVPTTTSDESFAALNGAAVLTVPAPLSDEQCARLVDAQKSEQAVFIAGTVFQRNRAITYFNHHKFVRSVSPQALAYHVEKVMDYKVDVLRVDGLQRDYQKCAMGILQLDVLRETDKATKADQNNRINDLRKAFEALNHFHDAIATMSDDEFVAWFAKKGGLDGIHREYRAANAVEVEPERDDRKIRAALDEMIANTSAVEVDNPNGSTGVRLFVARGEGDKLRLVPLDASPDFIASLSGRVPDPLEKAPAQLVLFRELLMTAARIVPDQMSDTPKRPLRDGEKVSESTEMLPANQIVRVEDGVFSVAGSRVEDSIVLEVHPADEILARYLVDEGFIDTMTRKNMLEKLEASATAAGFESVGITNQQSNSGPEVRISFEHSTKSLNGQLIVKSIDRLRSVYTWKAAPFKSTASASMDATKRKLLNDRFIAPVVKSRDDHPITVTVGGDAVSFQFGTAKAEKFSGCETEGSEAVRVTKTDFLRAINGLLALPLQDDLSWMIDPRGHLCIAGFTASADYRVYVQTLRKEKDAKVQVRERARLERVERKSDIEAAA